jgi:hypothetical protein
MLSSRAIRGDRLRFWVDTDSDGTWSDETEHFNDTSVIDDAGYPLYSTSPNR